MHSVARFKYFTPQGATAKRFTTPIPAISRIGIFWRSLENLENEFRSFKTFFHEMYAFQKK